jgi:uncharacterized protein (TIGR02996 family)
VSDTEKALLTAITTDPDDDVPRLAYADYLDERGDQPPGDRATFIRVQVEADRELNALSGWKRIDEESRRFWADPERRYYGYKPPTERVGRRKPRPVPPTAFDRGQELLARYEETWVEPFDPWLRRYSDSRIEDGYLNFRRGFLHRFTMTVKGFRDHAAELFARAPVVELWFPEMGDQYGELAGRPELARVRSLDLRDALPMSDGLEGMEQLLRSPRLAGLRSLTMDGPPCVRRAEPPGHRALLGPHHLVALERLDLTSDVQDEFVRALAESARLPALTTLLMPQATIGAETATALAESRGLAAVRLLDLSLASVSPKARQKLVERFGDWVRFKKGR